jgi:hypothetical protein
MERRAYLYDPFSFAMTLPPIITKYLRALPSLKGDGRPRPSRDWLILVGLFLVLFVVSVVWNVWFFSSALTGESAAVSENASETTDLSPVERAKETFRTRAEEEGRYRSEYRFVDPSR